MTPRDQNAASSFDVNRRTGMVAVILIFVAATMTVAAPSAHPQTFTVLHSFTGADGAGPQAHLTLDNAGNLYGTANTGGDNNGGTAFKLSKRNGSWIFAVLHDLNQSPIDPGAHRMVFGPDGVLYGSTRSAGIGVGTVFALRPSATFCASVSCPWTQSTIYQFQGGSNGSYPGDIAFDHAGNIFGAAADGGTGQDRG